MNLKKDCDIIMLLRSRSCTFSTKMQHEFFISNHFFCRYLRTHPICMKWRSNDMLVAGCFDKTIRVIDPRSMKLFITMENSRNIVQRKLQYLMKCIDTVKYDFPCSLFHMPFNVSLYFLFHLALCVEQSRRNAFFFPQATNIFNCCHFFV